jgi:acetyl-CoA carboxylase alpha subunit
MVIGHEKGNDTNPALRNFGMARPEGYRKAIRLMDMADRFGLPVVTLVDTPGAYGKGAEERGQSGGDCTINAEMSATESTTGQRHHRRWIGRRCGVCHGQPRRDAAHSVYL